MEPERFSPSEEPEPPKAVLQQQRVSGGGLPGRLDPDVASLSLTIDQYLQALTKDAVDQLLAVRARMLSSLEAAVVQEHEDGNKRLEAKQAEVDAMAAELKHTQQLLTQSDNALDRVAGGYAAKQRAVYERLNLLRSWYVWREWAHNERRLQHLGLRTQQWYVRRWLLRRAWDRWLGQARLQYRTLVAERAEKQQKADAAVLHAIHAKEAAELRAQVEGLQQQLQHEAEARNKMEEEMKRSFMRGVTAINLEALQIMCRGAPPSGSNPFPMVLPLTASTAAAGLVAVGGGQQATEVTDGSAGAGAEHGSTLSCTLQDWATSQQIGAAGPSSTATETTAASAADAPNAAAAGCGLSWGQFAGYPQLSNEAAQSAYGAAAVVQLQPYQQQQKQEQIQSTWSGSVGRSAQQQSSPVAARGGASVPRVHVERGPARSSPAVPAVSPAHKGVGSSPASAGRSVGVRRSLHQGGR